MIKFSHHLSDFYFFAQRDGEKFSLIPYELESGWESPSQQTDHLQFSYRIYVWLGISFYFGKGYYSYSKHYIKRLMR